MIARGLTLPGPSTRQNATVETRSILPRFSLQQQIVQCHAQETQHRLAEGQQEYRYSGTETTHLQDLPPTLVQEDMDSLDVTPKEPQAAVFPTQ